MLTQILAFCSNYQSMNKIGRDFNSDVVIENINSILKTNYVELPHKDTLINVISEIKYEGLEKIQNLIRSKMLDKYRFCSLLLKMKHIQIRMVKFDKQYCELKAAYGLIDRIKKLFFENLFFILQFYLKIFNTNYEDFFILFFF